MSNEIKSFHILTAVAVAFFEANPTVEEVFVTEDGQVFLMENRASLHAQGNNFAYKKFERAFMENENPGELKTAVEEVQTPKQPNVLQEKDTELRGADEKEAEKAQAKAEEDALKIEADEQYESVASIVAKIPEMDVAMLTDYLTKEEAKAEPRKTLVKVLNEAIAKFETTENA